MKQNFKLNQIASKLTNDMTLRKGNAKHTVLFDSVPMICRQISNYTSNMIQKESSKLLSNHKITIILTPLGWINTKNKTKLCSLAQITENI